MKILDKRKLRQLDVATFPSVIESNQVSNPYYNESNGYKKKKSELKYIFTAKISRNFGSPLLVVTFFDLDIRKATFRIFFNKKSFLTERLYPKQKWSESTLHSLWRELCYLKDMICANAKSEKTIQKFFGVEVSPFSAMDDFQQDLRDKRLATRHKTEADRIDEKMKLIRPLPKGFENWLHEVPFNFSRYIYYKRVNNRLIKGYCTSCGNDIEFRITSKTPQKNIRHNQRGRCPKCSKAIEFRAEGKTGYRIDEACATYIQKTKTGFVLRLFDISKRYSNNPDKPDYYRHPVLTISEIRRHFYDKDIDGKWFAVGGLYYYGDFKQTGRYRWCRDLSDSISWVSPVYTRNLNYVMTDTPWQYSALYELAKNSERVRVQRYLATYSKYPVYEYLVKSKLYGIVYDAIEWANNDKLNLKGRNVPEVLQLSHSGFKQLQRLNGMFNVLDLIKASEESGQSLTDEQIYILQDMCLPAYLVKELLTSVSSQRLINYISRTKKHWVNERNSDEDVNIATYWRDYLKNCRLLGYDMENDFILFPRNLKARHDEAVASVKVEKNELQERLITQLYPSLQGVFGYAHKKLGLTAIAPSTRGEIIAEGQNLRHCVYAGSYIDNIIDGKGYILFVRKANEPELPFYTAEVVDGVIRQCRGEKNGEMTDDVKSFVDDWQKQLTKTNARSFSVTRALNERSADFADDLYSAAA